MEPSQVDLLKINIGEPILLNGSRCFYPIKYENKPWVLILPPYRLCYRPSKDVCDQILFTLCEVDRSLQTWFGALENHIYNSLDKCTSDKCIPTIKNKTLKLKNHEFVLTCCDRNGCLLPVSLFDVGHQVQTTVHVDHFWKSNQVCGLTLKLVQAMLVDEIIQVKQVCLRPIHLPLPLPPPPPPMPPPPPPPPKPRPHDSRQFAPNVKDILDMRSRLKSHKNVQD